MNAYKESHASLSKPSPGRERGSYVIPTMLAGLVPTLLFFFAFVYARIGPAGHLWWEGKGGESIPTPLARTICIAIFAVGALAGGLCRFVLEVRWRPGIPATKPSSEAQQEHLWDRELDE
jgi:hypothetical protein